MDYRTQTVSAESAQKYNLYEFDSKLERIFKERKIKMEYSIANEIKSQTRVVGNIYAYDFIFSCVIRDWNIFF